MPTYKDETQKYHIERVREVLVLNPRATERAIQTVLEQDASDPLKLNREYIRKLKKKIKGERQHRFDKKHINERLAELQDRTEGIIAQMWKILLDTEKSTLARVAAARTIIDAEQKLLEAQMDAGIFDRKLGTVDIEHTHTLALSPEHKALALAFLRNHGAITKPNIAALPDGARSGEIIGQSAIQG